MSKQRTRKFVTKILRKTCSSLVKIIPDREKNFTQNRYNRLQKISAKNKCFFAKHQRSELRKDRAYDCGCNSGTPLMDAVGYLRKRTHPPLEQYILYIYIYIQYTVYTRTTQFPTVKTHAPHYMQAYQAYSKPVV